MLKSPPMDLKTYSQSNSQIDLARKLGVTAGAVSQWVNGFASVPAERCPAIEHATGGLVRCEDLRPDVRWDVLRVNQAQSPATIAQAATENVAQGVASV